MKTYEFINSAACHLEVIESVIYYRDIITKQKKLDSDRIILRLRVFQDEYADYIKSIIPNIEIQYHDAELDPDGSEAEIIDKKKKEKYFSAPYKGSCDILQGKPNEIDYQIHITANQWDLEKAQHQRGQYYICHQVSEITKQYENVYHLTPINGTNRYFIHDQLPYVDKINPCQGAPIYLALGALSWRDMDTLVNILECPLDFKVKVLTRDPMPPCLKKYNDKLIYKNIPQFLEFHREILDCSGILTLTKNEQGNPSQRYYTNTLTSSITYGVAYDLKFIIDEDLYRIYSKHINNADTYTAGDKESLNQAIKNSINP